MTSTKIVCLLATTVLACAGLTAANAAPVPHRHPPAAHRHKADPRDQRIAALEAEVSALTTIVAGLQQRPAASVAADNTRGTSPTGSGQLALNTTAGGPANGSTANTGDASPPATSPDQTRPVTSSVPGPSAAGATILAGKPSIQSGDGRFVANLHSTMQFDAADYIQNQAGPVATDLRRAGAAAETSRARNLASGTNFRRARIGIDGKVFGDVDYNVLFEFGGAGLEDAGHIQELWLQYTGIKPFRFRVGAFPPSYGLEDQGSTNGMLFLERPAIADITRSVAGGDFREAGQLVASDNKRWFANIALTTRIVGVANAASLASAPSFNQSFGGIARVAVLPLVGDDTLIHLGAHGSRVFKVADTGGPDVALAGRYPVNFQERAELRVDGTRLIATGAINAAHVNTIGAEAIAQKQQFMVQGEYEQITVERLASALSNPHFSGWYVEGSWVLTGERRKYNTGTFAVDAPTVDHPFDARHGTYGAFELAARYSVTNLNYNAGSFGTATPADGIRGGKQSIVTAGLNWYLNPIVRFMFDYQHVQIDHLSPNAATFLTPVGADIGQRYDVISLRSQLAF